MDGSIKGYSQWFPGKKNNIEDTLSWDWHRDDNKLTSILRFHFPTQMPKHFVISPIPSKINSLLISLLRRLPVREQLRERHTTTQLKPGGDGQKLLVNCMQRLLPQWTWLTRARANTHPRGFWHGSQGRKILNS